MAVRLFESSAKPEPNYRGQTVVANGKVVNNCDITKQGKVQVRIPSLQKTVWARLVAPGAGPNTGMLHTPNADDEVLVAVADGGGGDAYVLGGLWNSQDSPPVDSPPEAMSQRVIKTGLKGGVGHQLVFDDVKQSITLTSSTKQKITMDPAKIELTNMAGSVKVTLDNATQTVMVEGVNVTVKATANLTLEGGMITVKGNLVTVNSQATCSISGTVVKIN